MTQNGGTTWTVAMPRSRAYAVRSMAPCWVTQPVPASIGSPTASAAAANASITRRNSSTSRTWNSPSVPVQYAPGSPAAR